MGKQYIPGVSGLLTEQNPVDAPSNTLSEAENIVVEQGGKVQARHGFNINHKKNTTDLTDASIGSSYIYSSQYTNVLPFIKLLEYKDSNDVDKTVLFVKQTLDSYAFNNYGIYKVVGSTSTKNRYYLIDDQGEITGYKTLPYTTINNAFNTKETLYLQTENGIAEANIDNISSTDPLNFFDIKWPAFPELSYRLKTSDTYVNWLKSGTKFNIRFTFYREIGYTDKTSEFVYESEPSVPVLVSCFDKDSIPVIYLDFKTKADLNSFYSELNNFSKVNDGRKFGIRLYRTKSVPLNQEVPVEYYLCSPEVPFDNFLTGDISNYNRFGFENINWLTRYKDTNSILAATAYALIDQCVTDFTNSSNISPSINYDGRRVRFIGTLPTGASSDPIYYLSGDVKGTFTIKNLDGSVFNFVNPVFPNQVSFKVQIQEESYYYKLDNSDYNTELNIGDYVSILNPEFNQYMNDGVTYRNIIIFGNLSTNYYDSANHFISKLEDSTFPYNFDIQKNDYTPARMQIIDKILYNNDFFYKFKAIDNIFTTYLHKVTIYDPPLKSSDITIPDVSVTIDNSGGWNQYDKYTNNEYVRFITTGKLNNLTETQIYTVINSLSNQTETLSFNPGVDQLSAVPAFGNQAMNGTHYISKVIAANSEIKLLSGLQPNVIYYPLSIAKSFTFELNVDNNGIIGRPELYTNPNADSADNTNTIIPKSNFSYKYQDFWVYTGISSSLVGTIFVLKQPEVYKTTLVPDVNFIDYLRPGEINYKLQNFNTTSTDSFPLLTNGESTSGQKVYLDCPIFHNKDIQINTISKNLDSTSYIETVNKSDTSISLTQDTQIINPVFSISSGKIIVKAFHADGTNLDILLYDNDKISFNITRGVAKITNIDIINNTIQVSSLPSSLINGLQILFFRFSSELGTSDDVLPKEIIEGYPYYIRNWNGPTRTFQISETPTGSIIDITETGFGNLSCTVMPENIKVNTRYYIKAVNNTTKTFNLGTDLSTNFISCTVIPSVSYPFGPTNVDLVNNTIEIPSFLSIGTATIIDYYVRIYPNTGATLPGGILESNIYKVSSWDNATKKLTLDSVDITSLSINTCYLEFLPYCAFTGQSLSSIKFQSNIYELSRLTLKLTSIFGQVNEVSILTYPFYNRNGYYNKYSENGSIDNKALEYSFSANEANGPLITSISNDLVKFGKDSKIYNVPGRLNNEAMYNGRFKSAFTTDTATFTIATTDINTTTDTLKLTTGLTSSFNNCIIVFTANAPGGITLNSKYYIRNYNKITKEFKLSTTVFGSTVDITSIPGAASNVTITQSSIIFNESDGGVLIVRNISTQLTTDSNIFDAQSFYSPGFVFIQWQYNNKVSTSLISYSSLQNSSDDASSYIFTNAKIVAGITNLSSLNTTSEINSSSVVYLYALKGSSISDITLYPYSNPPVPEIVELTYSTTNSNSSISSVIYNREELINKAVKYSPFFTVVPHKSKSNVPIAILSQDMNHIFVGQNAGYAKYNSELLDEYAYSIVDKFNKELKIKGINAFLVKAPGLGEINIIYPDGQKIEIKNDYGSHEFLPNINNNNTEIVNQSSFTTLTERVNNEYLEKNLIQWSRRNIPEVTTGKLYAYIGKNNKKIIGMSGNTNDLYVFKEDGIWRCGDEGNTNGYDLPVVSNYLFSNNFICQSSGSIQEINDEIIFLSQYGFTSIANGGIGLIDQSINRDVITLLSVSPKDRIRSFVNESKNLYYCTLINETDPSLDVKSGTYVFNTRTRQWSFMDEEILTGIEDSQNRSVVAFRQRPVKAKRTATKTVSGRQIPVFDFTNESTLDDNGHITLSQETTPLDMYYIAREQHTNNVKRNAVDQYDFKYSMLNDDSSTFFNKSDTNEFYFITESVPNVASDKVRHKFRSSAHIALRPDSSTPLPADTDTVVIDSYIFMFANRSIYLQKVNSSLEMYEIRIKKTDTNGNNLQVYFEFVGDIPTWFSNLSNGSPFLTTSTYRILAGIPVKITFNPESGNAPDTNKLFQEYMIHTETANRGAVMSFKTDSRSNLTSDRRFVYDAATTNRNVFRTYIPMNASRGRYLIRQIKHDLPLENLIITGQTVVMRDSGSTRVQKDKDNE